MLSESKSLPRKKQYISNYNLRVTFADEETSEHNPLNAHISDTRTTKQSAHHQPLGRNFMLGDADTIFLGRENDMLSEELLELINQIE